MATSAADQDKRRQIILRMRGVRPSRVIVKSATRIARTFRGRLSGQFIENRELLALSSLPFAREIAFSGAEMRLLTPEIVRSEMAAALELVKREFEALTRAQGFEAEFEAPVEAGGEMRKPAGILAVGEPLEQASPQPARLILDEISGNPDVAAILAAGNRAERSSGPVLALLETGCDVIGIVDTAERIARADGETITLVVIGHEAAECEQLEKAARSALDQSLPVRWHRVDRVDPRSFAQLCDFEKVGLVIASSSGELGGSRLVRYACQLNCPLLLMR